MKRKESGQPDSTTTTNDTTPAPTQEDQDAERVTVTPEELELAKTRYAVLMHTTGATPDDDPELNRIYREWPMYHFYQNRRTQMPYRSYGVARCGKEPRLLVVFPAHGATIGFRIGGVPASEIEPVARWSRRQLQLIRKTALPELFLRPDGWIQVATLAQQRLEQRRGQQQGRPEVCVGCGTSTP